MRRLATMSHDDSEANWNRWTDRHTDGQDHVLSQVDVLTTNNKIKNEHSNNNKNNYKKNN